MPRHRSTIPNKRFSLVTNPLVILALAAIGLLLVISHYSLRQTRISQEQLLAQHLEATAVSTRELLLYWQQQQLASLEVLGESPRGNPGIKRMLREGTATPEEREAFRFWLYPIMLKLGFDGYSVINLDRVLVDASSEKYLGQPVVTPEAREGLDRVAPGKPVISIPFRAPRPTDGPRGKLPAGTWIQNACMLIQDQGQSLGYFCLRFNSHSSFFTLLSSGRPGSSGDIYTIGRDGRILTPPRFDHPDDAPLVDENWRQLFAKIPGDPPRLTPLAHALLSQDQPAPLMGYPDYRGVQVAGAGRWMPELDMGLVVEQDMAEGFASYYVARKVIWGLTLSALVLIAVLTASALINRRRLAQREGHFRSLLDNIPVPVYMCDLYGSLTVVNPAFCDFVSLGKTQLLGQPLLDLPLPAWLRPMVRVAEQTARAASQGSDKSHFPDARVVLYPPESEARYYRLVNFPVTYWHEAGCQAFACTIMDETAQVEAAQQQAAMNQRLEQLVDERTRELVDAKEEALAASRAKAEFLANMSHEIRTPLNAIIGLAHVSLAAEVEPKQRAYLEKMRAAGEHLLEVINNILNFSRLEAGKLRTDEEDFLLSDLVERTFNLVSEKAREKGLLLNAWLDPRIPDRLLGDPLRLGQILINFCANAVKFTDQGQIDINVLAGEQVGQRIALEFQVRDTGIGIAPELLPGLFEPFHQVDASSKRRFEGAGLGLAICKRLAEIMDAELEVESEPGKGSCFSLRISLGIGSELVPEARSPEPRGLPLPDQRLQGRVLVVEDNLLNQEIVRSLLENWGLHVSLVASGTEALSFLQTELPDVILMDIQLPGMDGVETTQHIRRLPFGARLPIIALTANALPSDREAYLAAGMDDYLAKPINPHRLHALAKRWLGQSLLDMPERAIPAQTHQGFEPLAQLGLDTAGALARLMDNENLYRQLLGAFAAERSDFPAELVRLIDINDRDSLLNQVHSLTSLSASLGMTQLHQLSMSCEQTLRTGLVDCEELDALAREVRQMVTLINAWLAAG